VKKSIRSVLLSPHLALFAAAALIHAGCAPTLQEMHPDKAPDLPAHPLRSIAVLPVDLTIDADDPEIDSRAISPGLSERAAERATPYVAELVRRDLRQRGYRAVEVAWDGSVPLGPDVPGLKTLRRPAIPPEAVASLSDWMLARSTSQATGRVPEDGAEIGGSLPYFGTDATLYVGGFGHLHKDETTRGRVAKDVAQGIGIALLIIAITAIIVLCVVGMAKGGGGGGGLGGLGNALSGFGRAAGAVAKVSFEGLKVGTRVAIQSHRVALDAVARLPLDHVHGPGCNDELGVHDGHAVVVRDAVPETPGQPNYLLLGAVLVDNATGRVLWSGAQTMPVDPVDGLELRHAYAHVMREFPRAGN
jgi:hypothetical protein